jgi:hypothetical protein
MHLEADDLGHTDGAIEVDVERAEYLSHMNRLQTWRDMHMCTHATTTTTQLLTY